MITYEKKKIFEIKLLNESINEDLKKKLENISNILNGISKSNNSSNDWRKKKSNFIKLLGSPEEGEINSNLNKLSPKNFDNISNNLIKVLEKKKDLLSFCIENIFKKAVSQPVYCNQYVKLFNIFIGKKFEIQNIINEKCAIFTNLLEYKINNNKDEVFDYDEFCKSMKEKSYKNGFSQFIGELANHDLINSSIIDDNLNLFINNLDSKIVEDPKSEYIEDNILCISKLILISYNKITNLNSIILKLKDFREKDIQIRLKFKLLDIIEKFDKSTN
jgi:hypothetical protein